MHQPTLLRDLGRLSLAGERRIAAADPEIALGQRQALLRQLCVFGKRGRYQR
jgi:hypothetical protein